MVRRKYQRLYRVATTYGIDIDDKAPYVVRWMLEDADTPDEGGSGLASIDDLAALEQERSRARAAGVTDGGS